MLWKSTPLSSLQIDCRGFCCTRPYSLHTGKGRGSQTFHGPVRLPQDQQPVPGPTYSGELDTLPLDLAPGRSASSASWQHTEHFQVWTPEPGLSPSSATYQLGGQGQAPPLIHLLFIYSAPTMCRHSGTLLGTRNVSVTKADEDAYPCGARILMEGKAV